MTDDQDIVVVARRRICGCAIAAALDGTAAAIQLEQAYGPHPAYRVVRLALADAHVATCAHDTRPTEAAA